MINEEFEKLVLEKFADIEKNMATKSDISWLGLKTSLVAEHVLILRSGVSGLNADTISSNAKLDRLAEDQAKDILTLLKNKMATKEDVLKIEAVLNVLSARTIEHEAELERLKEAR